MVERQPGNTAVIFLQAYTVVPHAVRVREQRAVRYRNTVREPSCCLTSIGDTQDHLAMADETRRHRPLAI